MHVGPSGSFRIYYVGLDFLFMCFAPWFFRFMHFRALFSLLTTVGPGLILRLIKQYKTCLFDVFCCFCFPFSLLFRSLFYFSGLFLLGSSLSLSSGGLFRWFRFHSAGSLMRVSLGWNWITGEEHFHTHRSVASITTSGGYHHREPNPRTEKQRRYHIRRKIRFRCRIEAVVYLRFLYERCA